MSWMECSQYKESETNKEEDRAWKKLPGSFRTYLLVIFTLVILITLEIGYSSIRTLGTEHKVIIAIETIILIGSGYAIVSGMKVYRKKPDQGKIICV